jgi:hypothetical protein
MAKYALCTAVACHRPAVEGEPFCYDCAQNIAAWPLLHPGEEVADELCTG